MPTYFIRLIDRLNPGSETRQYLAKTGNSSNAMDRVVTMFENLSGQVATIRDLEFKQLSTYGGTRLTARFFIDSAGFRLHDFLVEVMNIEEIIDLCNHDGGVAVAIPSTFRLTWENVL